MTRNTDARHLWPTRFGKERARRRAAKPKYLNPRAGVRDSRTLALELVALMAERTPQPTTQAKAQPNE